MKAKAIPNLITLFRILLVVPLVWWLVTGRYGLVLIVFALAGGSDALDGHLARRFGWSTRLGAVLDPLADKLMLVSAYVALGWIGVLPLWLVVLVLLRDGVIVAGAVAYRLVFGEVEMAPTLISKANTALQILLVLVVLFSLVFQPLPQALTAGIILAVAASTAASGALYVWTWGRRALRRKGGDD